MANPQITCNVSDTSTRSCPYQTFSLGSAYPGRKPEVKQQIVESALNASRVRDISQLLRVSSAR